MFFQDNNLKFQDDNQFFQGINHKFQDVNLFVCFLFQVVNLFLPRYQSELSRYIY